MARAILIETEEDDEEEEDEEEDEEEEEEEEEEGAIPLLCPLDLSSFNNAAINRATSCCAESLGSMA